MSVEDFEKKLENMGKPEVKSVPPPMEIKLAIVNSQRSAALGIWFIVVPCYFLFCVFMKYYFHFNLGLFDTFIELMASLDKTPGMKFISPILLVGLPLAGIVLNVLAICHFSFDSTDKTLKISIKLRWLNIAILILSLALVGIFMGYAFVENIHHQNL
ncbi:MAG: hypothetical protein HY015_09610 [Bacteroidetes bacterium]|nr:hypothetical protein [Bacteroidota bacterium]MBI3483210.1 hypothetical protein [Bacteroidota bacterium]